MQVQETCAHVANLGEGTLHPEVANVMLSTCQVGNLKAGRYATDHNTDCSAGV
jgi:hypothetical protein